jgi:heat shock protein HslJ
MIAIESRGYRHLTSVGLKHITEHMLEGDWLVVEIGGETVEPQAPRSVRFEGDRVTGRVGVNRFTGSFTIEGDVLEAGPIAATRMAGTRDDGRGGSIQLTARR